MLDTAIQAEASLDNMVGADGAISRFVGQIGLTNQFGANASVVDMDMKMAQVENPTTNPFLFGQPVAGFVPSLSVLHGQFQLTDPTRAASEAAAWQSTASTITSVISELGGVLAALSSSAETDWVSRAIERVNRIQWAGGQYAAHATAMAVHTGNLATVAGAEKIATAAAYMTWLAAPLPAKPLLEQSYMTAFTPRLNAGLIPTVPAFNQLLPPLDAMPGTSFVPEDLQVPPTPSFDRSPLPKVVRDALSANGYEDLAYAETPSEIVDRYGLTNPHISEVLAPGATPTHSASTVATMPQPTLGAGMPGMGAPGVGAAGMGTPGSGFAGLGGFNHAGLPGQAFAGGGFGPVGVGAAGGAGRAGAHGGAGRLGAGLGAGLGTGIGAGRAGGFAGGSGNLLGSMGRGGIGAPGIVAGTGAGGSSTGVLGGASSISGSQNGSRTVAVGGPMAGAAGGGAGGAGKRRRIRAVTSAVERQGNLRELLGEAPAVLPDVIGEGVRAPR